MLTPHVASQNTVRVKAHSTGTDLAPSFLTSRKPHESPRHSSFEQAKQVLLQGLSVRPLFLWSQLFWMCHLPHPQYLEGSVQMLSLSERPFLASICKVVLIFLPCLPLSIAATSRSPRVTCFSVCFIASPQECELGEGGLGVVHSRSLATAKGAC